MNLQQKNVKNFFRSLHLLKHGNVSFKNKFFSYNVVTNMKKLIFRNFLQRIV